MAYINLHAIRAKILGVILITIGAYIVLIFGSNELLLKLGFGSIFIGLFAIFIITERIVPQDLNEAQLRANLEVLDTLIADLNLRGNGIYFPAEGNLAAEKVFIPLEPMGAKGGKYLFPTVHDDMVFATGTGNTSLGVVFTPPGLHLLNLIERNMHIKLKGLSLEELNTRLEYLCTGLNLVKTVTIYRVGNTNLRVRLVHSMYASLCRTLRKELSNICTKVSCPVCSTILCAITRVEGKKVRIDNITANNTEVKIQLQLL
jgi:hypothetical protein